MLPSQVIHKKPLRKITDTEETSYCYCLIEKNLDVWYCLLSHAHECITCSKFTSSCLMVPQNNEGGNKYYYSV